MWGSAIKKCLLAAGLCSGFHVVAALERSGEGLRVFDFGVWAWVYGFHNLFKPYLKMRRKD